jgi:hypothetical protein
MGRKMSYVIRREFGRDRAAIVFEFDPQSKEELLQDFPWLRQLDARKRGEPGNGLMGFMGRGRARTAAWLLWVSMTMWRPFLKQ